VRAEAAVIGAILLDNDALNRIISTSKADDFYRESHREIYRAMIDLANEHQPIDTVTLSKRLRDTDKLKAAGGGAYLIQLAAETPAAVNVEHYAKIVRDKAVVRSVVDAARTMADEGLNDPPDVQAFVERVQQKIFEVTTASLSTELADIRTVIAETFKHLEELFERKERVTGIPTGFVDLDNKMGGLQPSDLVICAGRPAMGKTAFAMNVLTNAALRTKMPVVVFSLEMSAQQLAMRMLCSEARVSSADLRAGQASENDWSRLIKAVGSLSETQIFIDDTPAISLLELRARARRLKQERGLCLIAIDYLQLMRGSDLASRRSREQEISEISRGLKALAKELEVPVMALSQLNRGVESRTEKRPMMSDLRESGAIEQDADVVMFLYRDEYYNPESTDKKGLAEVIIGKQRHGSTGTVELKFQGRYTRFDNFAREYEDHGPPPPAGAPF